MGDLLHCPKCGFEFEASSALRESVQAELRAQFSADADRRVADAAAEAAARLAEKESEVAAARRNVAAAKEKEAELLGKTRALEERERDSALAVERKLADEAKRIRAEETKAADERAARRTAEQLRAKDEELEDARAKAQLASANEVDLLRRARELEERERDADLKVERKLAEESSRMRGEEAKAADERAARRTAEQLRAKDEELDEARKRVDLAAAKETALLRKARELEEREQHQTLEIERRLAEEGKVIRARADEDANERTRLEREKLRLAETEHAEKMTALQRKLDELQQRVHQGSQQAQGEAQEVALRDLLGDAFAMDAIDDVPKGVQGADLVQRVRSTDGREHGIIVWESKRTKSWANDWLPKLRDDQRTVGASIAVLVTQALPDGTDHFELIDGVWVCGWPYAAALCAALRASLVDVSHARRAQEGAGYKMQMLYDYLTGTEFRNRVGGLVEAFREMEEDLAREKRAMLSLWKKRERQLIRARDNMAAFYGDLRGIEGRNLPDLPGFSLEEPSAVASFDAPDAEIDEEAASGSPVDAELVEVLWALVPADGSTVGNGSLCRVFAETVLVDHGVQIEQPDYERHRNVLIATGRLRKGQGRGGSVARVVRG